MKTEWKKEKCASLPEEFQLIADDIYMQRRNIRMIPGTEEIPDGGYECECRRISADVYDALMETLSEPSYMSMKATLDEQGDILAATQIGVEYNSCLQELLMNNQ